tara:strand:+ start:682 stop:948 length:267 start_codon:yes stop_codon:yes gene_type:complete
MNTTPEESNITMNETAEVQASKKRGRPKVEIVWPEGNFTFDSLKQTNVLSSSSLRKKMRTELMRGGILKVDTLKTAFGRPHNVYKKAQ